MGLEPGTIALHKPGWHSNKHTLRHELAKHFSLLLLYLQDLKRVNI